MVLKRYCGHLEFVDVPAAVEIRGGIEVRHFFFHPAIAFLKRAGFFSAILRRVAAAPEGFLRPCSQSCRVRTETPRYRQIPAGRGLLPAGPGRSKRETRKPSSLFRPGVRECRPELPARCPGLFPFLQVPCQIWPFSNASFSCLAIWGGRFNNREHKPTIRHYRT